MSFDPESFANATIEAELSTRAEPIPPDTYAATIEKVGVLDVKGYACMDVTWKISAPELEEVDGRFVTQRVFLDITDSGQLDVSKGKNVTLGRIRNAVGQNVAGQAWSPNMLFGQSAMIQVINEGNKKDPTDENIYDRVKTVSAA